MRGSGNVQALFDFRELDGQLKHMGAWTMARVSGPKARRGGGAFARLGYNTNPVVTWRILSGLRNCYTERGTGRSAGGWR